MDRRNYSIGIDPGLRGAVCVLDKSGAIEDLFVLESSAGMIDGFWLHTLLVKFKKDLAWVTLEKTHTMPGQGIVGAHNYGINQGVIIGVVRSLGYPLSIVGALIWQKEIWQGATSKSKNPKQVSKLVAKNLFPLANFRATPRCTTDHDGIIDALLIAEYGRRRTYGNDSK